MSKESREKKAKVIDSLQDTMAKSSISILTDYRGLTTHDLTNLRRKLRESGSELKVVKNTLARFAAERAGQEDMAGGLKGPIAIAFGHGDIMTLARVLTGFIRETQSTLSIKGGFLSDRLLTREEVMTLSTLPSREVLIARVLGQMKSPVSNLLVCLASPIRGFIGILQARIKQMEGE